MSEISTKPYFMRAIYEWCTDNGYTPYLAVKVHGSAVRVPMEFVRNGEIVLNISFGATSGLKMDNEAVTFKARFGGVSRDIYVPVENVQAVYASENGQGMAFDVGAMADELEDAEAPAEQPVSRPIGLAAVQTDTSEKNQAEIKNSPEPQKKVGKPSLKIIK